MKQGRSPAVSQIRFSLISPDWSFSWRIKIGWIVDFHRDMGQYQMSVRVTQSFDHLKGEAGRWELPPASSLYLENWCHVGFGSSENLTNPEGRGHAAGTKDQIIRWGKRWLSAITGEGVGNRACNNTNKLWKKMSQLISKSAWKKEGRIGFLPPTPAHRGHTTHFKQDSRLSAKRNILPETEAGNCGSCFPEHSGGKGELL